MRTAFLLSLLLAANFSNAQMKISNIPPQQEKFFTDALSQSRPAIVNWVKAEAQKFKGKEISERAISADIKKIAPQLGNPGDQDIQALAFLVMMQASKDSQGDLQGVMQQIQTIEKKKDSLRKINASLVKAPGLKEKLAATPASRDSTIKPAPKNLPRPVQTGDQNLDQLSELGTQQQLKLQMLLDQRSKAEQAASNIFKKISATAATILQNFK